MTPSSFTWLQFDAEQSRRARELLRAVQEPGTLDSLGVGTIRDGFANVFFPGTSTIQTRARYFLLVPWALERVAASRPRTREQYDRRLRETEVAVIDALATGSPGAPGIIGIDRRAGLRNLPSVIYWSGTAAWGIRVAGDLSRSELRDYVLSHREVQRADDGEASPFLVWDDLPPAPNGFPNEPLSIFPEPEEAEYLLSRMAQTRVARAGAGDNGPSLLAHLARRPREAEAAAQIWDLPADVMTPRQAHLVDLAHGFAIVIQGARLRYLDLLFRARATLAGKEPDGRNSLAERLAQWLAEMSQNAERLLKWQGQIDALFADLSEYGATLHHTTRDFVRVWCRSAVEDPEAALTDPHLADLIRAREAHLKKSSARLSNDSPLLAWNGTLVGAEPLDYRWSIVRTHLLDCWQALNPITEPEAPDARP